MRVYFAQKIGKSFGNEQKIAELSRQNEVGFAARI
jgi:hypothetical protein